MVIVTTNYAVEHRSNTATHARRTGAVTSRENRARRARGSPSTKAHWNVPRPGASWLQSRRRPAPRCPRRSAICPSSHFASGLSRVEARALGAQLKVPTKKDGYPRSTGSRAGRGGVHGRAWLRARAHTRARQGALRQLKALCHRLRAPDSAFEWGCKSQEPYGFPRRGQFFNRLSWSNHGLGPSSGTS